MLTKISGDFAPCSYCAVKKISIDTTGAIVGDVDFKRLIKNTTFTVRWWRVSLVMRRSLKNYNEFGMKKMAVGAKVMTDSVAFDAAYDVASNKYNAGLVYSVNLTLPSDV